MADHFDVLIVGGGHGGAQVAISLRSGGFEGSVAILSDERDPPYERPPLSKDYLVGEKPFERLLLRPQVFWSEKGVQLLLCDSAISVDPLAHEVRTKRGRVLGYGQLVWAAGGRARRLSCAGGDLQGVHTVRSRVDVDCLLRELSKVGRVAVIGGGYIGLEAASALRRLDKQVIVLEALDRVLARVTGPPISDFIAEHHRSRGVEVRLNTTVNCIEGKNGFVTGVRLSTGEVVGADMIIIGIGIIPAVEPLRAAGATVEDGVLVDSHCRTSLRDIFAVGDCALHANPYAGHRKIRLESVQNANDQANVAAKNILNDTAHYAAIPWFWSIQHDIKLQTAGLLHGHDEIVVRGDPVSQSFSVLYLRGGRVIAVDAINSVKDYVQGRILVASGAAVEAVSLGDTSRQLKDFAS